MPPAIGSSLPLVVLMVVVYTGRGFSANAEASRLTVQADRLELNQQTGVQTLSGNVEIRQADISIRAETIQVTTSFGAISRIYGAGREGARISFQQTLANGQIIRTESNEIDYITRRWTLVFRGNVRIHRGSWKLSSDVVEYNVRSKNFYASSESGSNSRALDSRVRFTYGD